MLRTAGEGALRSAGHGVGVEEHCHGDGDAVLHTWLQVLDDDIIFVRKTQPELQHNT